MLPKSEIRSFNMQFMIQQLRNIVIHALKDTKKYE